MIHTLNEIAGPAFQGATIFGITYGLGRLFNAPDPLRGALISTITFIARYSLGKLADYFEKKYDLCQSTRYWIKIGLDTLTLVAVTVVMVALVKLDVLAVIIGAASSLIFIGVDIYLATHLKEDFPLSQRKPLA